ncbi:5824_t:CDS:10, partial [Racocetra fulgida]
EQGSTGVRSRATKSSNSTPKDVPEARPIRTSNSSKSTKVNASLTRSGTPYYCPPGRIAFIAFLIVRLTAVFFSNIADCDEVFNYWEPTHYLQYGYGMQTWEYSPEYAIRSWAYIKLHAIIGGIFETSVESQQSNKSLYREGMVSLSEFLKSDFNGQLPKYFLEDTQIDSESRTKMNYKRDGTWMLQEGFNDINKEEMDRYVDVDQCDYIVDLETNYTQASANEPRYVTQTDKDQLVIGIQKYINRNLNLNYGLLKIMSTTEELQTLVLTSLDVRGTIPNTKDLVTSENKEVDQLALLGALKSLSIVDKEMVKYETIEEEVWMLTDEGNEIANKGSHEAKVFDAIPIGKEGIAISALHEILGETAKIGQGKAFKNKWITKNGGNLVRAPQQHPARDAHDTFFLKDPAICTQFPTEYLERVKEVHSVGGYGSTGYGYDWKIEEAQKLILRTHTTAVSSLMLYNLAKQKEFKPVKYFSIDRVFRNETVDATHLAEFHQVEGVIADKGLTLGDLIGFMNTFFNKMGLGKWVEIGNSGMFRPEMLEPMGLDPDVRVIAW